MGIVWGFLLDHIFILYENLIVCICNNYQFEKYIYIPSFGTAGKYWKPKRVQTYYLTLNPMRTLKS